MSVRLAAAALACLLLSGCVKAEETWTLDGEGGGTYALSVTWDADLWRRVGEILGPAVMKRVADPGFPLRASQWRDGLKGLEGVRILELGESMADGGMRRIHVKVKFRRVEDVLKWEVLAGRRVRIEPPEEKGAARIARLRMEPIRRVPVLDRLAALADAVERGAPKEASSSPLDPSPLARFGLDDEATTLVAAMLEPALDRVSLRVHLNLRGKVLSVGGRPAIGEKKDVVCSWSFADLRNPKADRAVRCRWVVDEIDKVFPVDRHP